MYIWVAIDVDSQLLQQKLIIQSVGKEVGFKENVVLKLPFHISLKISAEVTEKYEKSLREDITNLFSLVNPFIVETERIETNGSVLWIRMKDNQELIELHNKLCDLYEKYDIPLHEFDKDFAYHTTFFLDSDKSKMLEAYERIKEMNIPSKLIANRFVIGSSPKGENGTYSVDAIINRE